MNHATIAQLDSDQIHALSKRLEALFILPDNWDSYGAEKPNAAAYQIAKSVFERARQESILPHRIDPSVEGGIVLTFANADRYADIECLNSGETLGMKHIRNSEPAVWSIQPFDQEQVRGALSAIRSFIHG